MADKQKRYWATHPFDYGEQSLDRGQITVLGGYPNDEKLTRLGYLREVPDKAEVYTCAQCGAQFLEIGARTGHGDKRHKRHPFDTPDDQDQRVEREHEIAEKVTPLNWDATAASRK